MYWVLVYIGMDISIIDCKKKLLPFNPTASNIHPFHQHIVTSLVGLVFGFLHYLQFCSVFSLCTVSSVSALLNRMFILHNDVDDHFLFQCSLWLFLHHDHLQHLCDSGSVCSRVVLPCHQGTPHIL